MGPAPGLIHPGSVFARGVTRPGGSRYLSGVMKLPAIPRLDPELDARLVERCLAGDARAWDALVRRHERLVYAVGRSYRLGDEDMGDVFQEVFGALVRSLPRLRDARTLVRWLSVTSERIARATALHRRREQALAEDDPAGVEAIADDRPEAGVELERLEAQALVRLALGTLSERCQKLLHALYFEDPIPAYNELSRRLGVPIGSLGPTRARCMDKLREGVETLSGTGRGISGAPAPTSPSEAGSPSGSGRPRKRPEARP